MRDSALLARDKGVMLHTHLAENDEDVAYSLAQFGCRPGQYAEELGWTGPDVWHAHCVKLDTPEIDLFARTRTGVAHCPCSNCRLGSGIAPVRAMRDAGVPVGLGVDGSASNDQSGMGAEARQAMLLQRVANGADAMSAREALEIATRGGADVLGRPDCGRLEPGKCADIAVWDTRGIDSAGSWDPAALLLAGTCVGEASVRARPPDRARRRRDHHRPAQSDRAPQRAGARASGLRDRAPPADPDLGNRPVIAHHDGWEHRLPQGFGAGRALGDGGGRGEVEHH